MPAAQALRSRSITNSAGEATFIWTRPFAAPPIVALAVQGGAGFRSVRIVSNTGTTTVVQAQGAAVVELLGIQILGAGIAAAGVTIHATATEP